MGSKVQIHEATDNRGTLFCPWLVPTIQTSPDYYRTHICHAKTTISDRLSDTVKCYPQTPAVTPEEKLMQAIHDQAKNNQAKIVGRDHWQPCGHRGWSSKGGILCAANHTSYDTRKATDWASFEGGDTYAPYQPDGNTSITAVISDHANCIRFEISLTELLLSKTILIFTQWFHLP